MYQVSMLEIHYITRATTAKQPNVVSLEADPQICEYPIACPYVPINFNTHLTHTTPHTHAHIHTPHTHAHTHHPYTLIAKGGRPKLGVSLDQSVVPTNSVFASTQNNELVFICGFWDRSIKCTCKCFETESG